jgi:hypothetical protein
MTLNSWTKTQIPRNNVQNSASYIQVNWCRNNRRKGFWWENLRERDDLKVQGVDGRIILTLNLLTSTIVAPPSNASKWQMGFNSAFKGLKWIFRKWDVGACTGSIWLRIGKGGRHL